MAPIKTLNSVRPVSSAVRVLRLPTVVMLPAPTTVISPDAFATTGEVPLFGMSDNTKIPVVSIVRVFVPGFPVTTRGETPRISILPAPSGGTGPPIFPVRVSRELSKSLRRPC